LFELLTSTRPYLPVVTHRYASEDLAEIVVEELHAAGEHHVHDPDGQLLLPCRGVLIGGFLLGRFSC
jgi:hypothetical protein